VNHHQQNLCIQKPSGL